jgi:lipoteichoic acid synthase
MTLLWTLKNIFFVHETELAPNRLLIFCSSLGFSILVASFLLFRFKWIGYSLAVILYTSTSFLFYADIVYNRYYHAILRIELLSQAKQLHEIKDSIYSLIYHSDIWYLVDIPIIILLMFFFLKKCPIKNGKIAGVSLFSVGAGIIFAISYFSLQFTYSDQYKVSLTGVIPAHVYDLSWNIYKRTYIKQTFLQENNLASIRKEFTEKQEIQKSSPYFGKFKGKNIIMVQTEALNAFPINLKVDGQEVTPNLNKLIQTSHYYPNTYLQIGRGNTSDAEFVANNSLYPMGYVGAYKGFPKNDYLSFANILNDLGYSTSATHGNSPEFWNRLEAYKKQGYSKFYSKGDPEIVADEIIGLGISDRSIFRQMAQIYKKETKPFFNFIISLSSHRPFVLPEKYQLLPLPEKMKNTSTGNYLESVHYFDDSLGYFIDQLKAEGIWDDTILVVYGDHYGPLPIDKKQIKDFLNVDFNEKTRFNIPLVIHHPGEEKGVLNEGVGSQMDIYPTLTALLGIKEPLVQLGTSLDADYHQIVGFAFETTRYSFYSDDYDYIAAHQGVFELGTCIDNHTKKPTDVQKCKKGYDSIFNDMQTSTFLLENNWIGKIFKNGPVLANGRN